MHVIFFPTGKFTKDFQLLNMPAGMSSFEARKMTNE